VTLVIDAGLYPNAKTDASTTIHPKRKALLISTSPNKYDDTNADINMDNDVAKPFSTLSAYLTTTATIRPPAACNMITLHTYSSYPCRKPVVISVMVIVMVRE